MVREALKTIGQRVVSIIAAFGRRRLPDKVKTTIANLTLSQRFMLGGLVILLGGMFSIGAWVEHQIITGVIHRAGATTALYVDSFVSPNLQVLRQSEDLLPEHEIALAKIMQNNPMGQQIVALRVWSTRGKLLYTTDNTAVGRIYPMTENLLRARLGEVVSEISQLDEVENAVLAAAHEELLETYSPVWLSGTDQIIAVAEFYHRTEELNREIAAIQRRTWFVVGLAILVMYLLLAGFVRNASDTIIRQQREVQNKVIQLTGLLAQNRALHHRVRRASASVALLNEGYLRRIGSELHDGPAQDLGLSLLKLDALAGDLESKPQVDGNAHWIQQLKTIEVSLQSALKETRAIATGLSLPHLAELELADTVSRVVRTHERRTGTRVNLELIALPEQVALPLKITVYRLIQEALNNAFRHANGNAQSVTVRSGRNRLIVEITDGGPGFDLEQIENTEGRLGLSGMRERVESLGGIFNIDSHPGQGARVTADLPIRVDDRIEEGNDDET